MIEVGPELKRSLSELCKKHKVKQLYVFGSAIRSDFDQDKSDLDLLVEFNNSIELLEYSSNFFSFQFALEDLFNRKIDLLSAREIKNPVFREIVDNSKMPLYAA